MERAMTYNIGDPGHVKAHSDLVSSINVELARFGLTGALPIKEAGDEGHLDDHNAIRAKLDELATLAGQSFSTPLPPVRQLGDGSHTDDHNILAECASEVATWAAWNKATGGIEQSWGSYYGKPGRWMTHTFHGNGTLNITIATQPFDILVVGGGGSGGPVGSSRGGGGGGGGGVNHKTGVTLPTGSHSVSVGGGGGTSSLLTFTANGGGGGRGGWSCGGDCGRGGTSGAPTAHGGGAQSGDTWNGGQGGSARANGANGRAEGTNAGLTISIEGDGPKRYGDGGGGGTMDRVGQNGTGRSGSQAGIVVVAYQMTA